MKVPLRWLNEFIDTGLSVKELTHRLTMAGLEAEKITTIGAEWANIYVGHVEAVERHPDADRLVLATVDAGEHQPPRRHRRSQYRPGPDGGPCPDWSAAHRWPQPTVRSTARSSQARSAASARREWFVQKRSSGSPRSTRGS